jgi:hypothetical protein
MPSASFLFGSPTGLDLGHIRRSPPLRIPRVERLQRRCNRHTHDIAGAPIVFATVSRLRSTYYLPRLLATTGERRCPVSQVLEPLRFNSGRYS